MVNARVFVRYALCRIPDRRQLLLLSILSVKRGEHMLWTIILILIVLWALGYGFVPAAGGLIHLLLVIALIVLIVQLITGRRPTV